MIQRAYNLHVAKRQELLVHLVDRLPQESLMSFEGELSGVLSPQFIFSEQEQGLLRRHTWVPRMDFWIFRLDARTKAYLKQEFIPEIGVDSNVIHVLAVAKDNTLFASHDHFHPECVFLTKTEVFTEPFMQQLLEEGIIQSFEIRELK